MELPSIHPSVSLPASRSFTYGQSLNTFFYPLSIAFARTEIVAEQE